MDLVLIDAIISVPELIGFSSSSFTVLEGSSTLEVTVVRTDDLLFPVVLSTNSGTATSGGKLIM